MLLNISSVAIKNLRFTRLLYRAGKNNHAGIKDTLDEDGTVAFDVINERDVNIPYVMRRVLNGAEEPIEEDEFPSKYIPLIPVVGEEVIY